MNLNAGSILNSAVTIGSAVGDTAANDPGKGSLKSFLQSISTYGVQIKSNFEVDYNGILGLQFFLQSISIPGLKGNNGQIFYKGRTIDVPINYEQEHEITMTVISDGSGFIYQTMRKIMIYDYNIGMVKNNYTMEVRGLGDMKNYTGIVIKMEGIRITNVSSLEFSHTANEVQTFTVNCQVATMQILQSQPKHEDGILDKVDKVTNGIDSAVSKVFNV